ncbi:hypothetical protein [Occallatibacter savannae]|uniref:hypothetical protein n=1 Tax=Occallatibacter savannae TaxID=1002691 RepID=UPI000D69CE17|nr:hypothetical protein [Occallatibacter savannae]
MVAERFAGVFPSPLLQDLGIQLRMEICAEYTRLAATVETILSKLTHLTSRHLDLFKSGDFAATKRLDRELELTIGEKERAIGALRQHMLEHKCQAGKPI